MQNCFTRTAQCPSKTTITTATITTETTKRNNKYIFFFETTNSRAVYWRKWFDVLFSGSSSAYLVMMTTWSRSWRRQKIPRNEEKVKKNTHKHTKWARNEDETEDEWNENAGKKNENDKNNNKYERLNVFAFHSSHCHARASDQIVHGPNFYYYYYLCRTFFNSLPDFSRFIFFFVGGSHVIFLDTRKKINSNFVFTCFSFFYFLSFCGVYLSYKLYIANVSSVYRELMHWKWEKKKKTLIFYN